MVSQRQKIQEFAAVTGSTQRVAQECLRACDWSVPVAVDHFYSCGKYTARAPKLDSGSIETLFQKYSGGEDVILAEGIMKFCEDLGVDPTDIAMLVLSYHMGAETMGEWKRAEFAHGMHCLQCDSVKQLQGKLGPLRDSLSDAGTFGEVYRYAYGFSCPKGQKVVQLEAALGMWRLLFDGRGWPHLDAWCDFLQEHHGRAISRDTWNQLLDFVNTIKPDLSNYDLEGGAWPYLLDEFVEVTREKMSAA
ncbi:unnamed protein product [Pedinophyceae sp. YPF-701]|nr:unnamed protein product [Pedinophyceae sp. YPF-701]